MEYNELINQEMFFLLAGPCVIEGEEMALNIAEHVKKVTDRLGIPYVFKGSFKKANRSRLDSFTGIGNGKQTSVECLAVSNFDSLVNHRCQFIAMKQKNIDTGSF